jgi:hypothetical protein
MNGKLRRPYVRWTMAAPSLVLGAALAILAPQQASAHAITGALFTTTMDGTTINGIYTPPNAGRWACG